MPNKYERRNCSNGHTVSVMIHSVIILYFAMSQSNTVQQTSVKRYRTKASLYVQQMVKAGTQHLSHQYTQKLMFSLYIYF